MKKTLFSTALLLASMFVASPSFANNSVHINPAILSQLKWQDVPLSATTTTKLLGQQKQTFTKDFAGIESPVAAYRIPASQGTVEVEIDSSILEHTVFVPSAVVLDSNFNIAAKYPSSEFKLQEERGLKPNRLSATLNLTPVTGQEYIYLLIYTTQQDLSSTTMVPHPAKLYAKATGNQPPAINDIKVAHSLEGEIQINVTALNGTRFIGIPTKVFGSDKNETVVGQTQAKSIDNTRSVSSSPVDKDTEAYFNQAVTKALKAKDVNKALNLVNEAEKLGLKSPRQIFLKHVSTN